ncbi:MAG: NAD(P)-dependent oxidoreductase [Bdellovibrionales bacterium]
MKVLITDRFHDTVYQQMLVNPDLEITRSEFQDLKPKDLEGVEGLLIRSKTRLSEELLTKAKDLQWIITTTSGFDHIDVEAAKKMQIKTYYCPEANLYSASELTIQLMLRLLRKTKACDKLIKSGSWNRESVKGEELYGKSLGIFGLGRIGTQVAKLADAFGMKVFACDPYTEKEPAPYVEMIGAEELLRICDIISLHVPKTKRTTRMLKAVHFEAMNDDAIIINCSRGNLISEAELVTALNQNQLRGAALDVFEKEPATPESELLNHPKVICSPHIGGNTKEAFLRGSEDAYEKIKLILDGKAPKDELPPKDLWYLESIGKL